MKTQEEFQSEVIDRTDAMENAIILLEKASMILSHWTQEYVFNEKPNPRKAVECGASMSREERSKG
ncbi:MAG: hypothetical protein WA125_01155 [Desulfosporosinus sp.]